MYRQLRRASFLSGTELSINWLHDVLTFNNGHKCRLVKWEDKQIGIGQGIASRILSVKFVWDHQGHLDHEPMPDRVVVKVPTLENMDKMTGDKKEEIVKVMNDGGEADGGKRKQNQLLMTAHKNECKAYWWLERHVTHTAVPKIYYAQEQVLDRQAVIVMEDLSDRGIIKSWFEGLSLEQIFSTVEALAALHAASLANKQWKDMLQDREGLEMFGALLFETVKAMLQATRPDDFEKFDDLAPFYSAEYCKNTMDRSHEEVGLPAVMVHGDLWINNILFDAYDPDQLLSIIDWQGVHAGNACEDLARLLTSSVDPELRRKETENILEFYQTKFNDFVGYEVATLEQVREGYQKVFPLTATFFMTAVPFVINSPMVEDGNKEENVEKMLKRAKALLEDVLEQKEIQQ